MSAQESRLAEFYVSIERQRDSGPDIYTRAHDSALADFLQRSETLRTVFNNFVITSPHIEPAQLPFRLSKSSQAMEMSDDPTFPAGRDTPKAWQPVFERLIDDDDYRRDYLFNLQLPIASNVSERGKLLKAIALLDGRTGPVGIMDVGCSLNHNLKRLALYSRGGVAYEPLEVMTGNSDEPRELEPDVQRTAVLNKLIQEDALALGPSLGVDLFDADRDPFFRNWARSNSFYMGELLDPRRTGQFDRLARARPAQVGFLFADATAADSKIREVEQKFDIVYFSTMLYQLGREGVQAALRNAHQVVKPDGLIVVQDFAEFKPDDSIEFYKKWHWPWHYNVWVKSMQRQEEGFQKYLSAESGRARQVILEPAIGNLAVARELGLAPSAGV